MHLNKCHFSRCFLLSRDIPYLTGLVSRSSEDLGTIRTPRNLLTMFWVWGGRVVKRMWPMGLIMLNIHVHWHVVYNLFFLIHSSTLAHSGNTSQNLQLHVHLHNIHVHSYAHVHVYVGYLWHVFIEYMYSILRQVAGSNVTWKYKVYVCTAFKFILLDTFINLSTQW